MKNKLKKGKTYYTKKGEKIFITQKTSRDENYPFIGIGPHGLAYFFNKKGHNKYGYLPENNINFKQKYQSPLKRLLKLISF